MFVCVVLDLRANHQRLRGRFGRKQREGGDHGRYQTDKIGKGRKIDGQEGGAGGAYIGLHIFPFFVWKANRGEVAQISMKIKRESEDEECESPTSTARQAVRSNDEHRQMNPFQVGAELGAGAGAGAGTGASPIADRRGEASASPTAPPPPPPPTPRGPVYDVEFQEGSLGMRVVEVGVLGYGRVERVTEGAAAARAGVEVSDVIVAVDSVSTPTYAEAMAAFGANPRPITASFRRGSGSAESALGPFGQEVRIRSCTIQLAIQ